MTATAAPATPGSASLLYVEDEDNDVLFMQRALARASIVLDFNTACDGDKAVAYLAGDAPHASRADPDLILLDLNLPARSGFEVLEWLRQQPSLREIPVVVISSSGRVEDRERAKSLGADDYMIKPASPLLLVEVARELWIRWLSPEARATRRRLDVRPGAPAVVADQSAA